MSAKKGEIWFSDLNPAVGREQAGKRPVLILSDSPHELVTVLPITSRPRPKNPARVEIRPPEGGLRSISYVICEQVRTISMNRLDNLLGSVSDSTMKKVIDAVCIMLDLP